MTLSTPERFHLIKEMGTKWMPTPDAPCQLIEWLIDAGASADVGSKRDFMLREAKGDIVVFLDDDDWHHPDRIAKQVAVLQKNPVGLVGTTKFYVHDTRSVRTTYSRTWGGADCMPAGTMAFWRDVALKGPGFAPGLCAELAFQRSWPGEVIDMQDPTLYVHVRHGNNVTPDDWVLNLCDVPPGELMSSLGEDFWWGNRG